MNMQTQTNPPADWRFQVFFDGDCPLCVREINMLRRWDKKQRIWFTDIAEEQFDPTKWGKSMEELMAHIHGRMSDGQWVEGVEVFRQLYTQVGLGPLVRLSRLPGISQTADWGYKVFAKNRLRLTGRCTTETCAIEPQSTR